MVSDKGSTWDTEATWEIQFRDTRLMRYNELAKRERDTSLSAIHDDARTPRVGEVDGDDEEATTRQCLS